MKKIISLVLLNACFNNKTESKNDGDNERKILKVEDRLPLPNLSDKEKEAESKNEEITSVTLEEGKIYTFNATFEDLKEAYKNDLAKISKAKNTFESALKGYNEIEDKSITFVEYFRNTCDSFLKNLEYFSEKLDKANSEEDIKELISEYELIKRLCMFRFQAFKVVNNSFEVYYFNHHGDLGWIEIEGLRDNKNWIYPSPPLNNLGFYEKIEDGIYYIHGKPFQIIEIENLDGVNSVLNNILKIILKKKVQVKHENPKNTNDEERNSIKDKR